MSLSAADRIALILGRAVMRAETLQTELDAARAKVAELLDAAEQEQEADDAP